MERPVLKTLCIGDWCVNPKSGQISRNGETARLEERSMRLLLCLAEHAGEVVSIDELLTQVWAGVIVTPDSVYQAVASLRRQLGDDPKQPSYIATVPRLGYRMVATVVPWTARADGSPDTPGTNALHGPSRDIDNALPSRHRNVMWTAAAAIVFCCVVFVALVLLRRVIGTDHPVTAVANSVPEKSIAVLPFLDLTEKMHEEEFADGMTEELIDKFSKIPGLMVPSPTASFVFKNKQVPLADIAKTLGVTYVLDGSVRKSGNRVRIAARLVRADNGYVIWSETYDRAFDDILMVQDDIAGEVTKALRNSIETERGQQ